MRKVKISTVITTYNRRHCVEKAIRSAMYISPKSEVIVVDDASTDETLPFLHDTFPRELASGTLRIVVLQENLGVSGAKNAGYLASSGDWVIFLDSDDIYVSGAGRGITDQLLTAKNFPIVFFRCEDHNGKFIGKKEGEEVMLDLRTYLSRTSYGEALTAINKRVVGIVPPYVAELRGYEGIGCSLLIQKFGPALLSRVGARVYDTRGKDRLSVSSGLFRRMLLLARGHIIMAREFRTELGSLKFATYYCKAGLYFSVGYIYCLLRPSK